MGIGSWLNMEHFMLGIPTPDNQIRKTVKEVFGKETADGFFDCFIRSFISDSDFAFLKKCGVNILRVPFNYRLFIDDQNPSEYKKEGLLYLDYLMDFCENYQIYLLLDLHTAPADRIRTGIPITIRESPSFGITKCSGIRSRPSGVILQNIIRRRNIFWVTMC